MGGVIVILTKCWYLQYLRTNFLAFYRLARFLLMVGLRA